MQPTPSTAPTPTPTLTVEWSEAPFDGDIAALIADGSRFVAVGADSEAVTAWTSGDGRTWEQHAVPEKVFPELGDPSSPMRASMGPLVRLNGTLYSFGGTWFIDNRYPAGWRWTDQGAWELIESSSDFFQGGNNVTALTSSDTALMAVDRGPYGYHATVWLWTADTSWIRTGLQSTGAEDVALLDVSDIAWADGRFVAVGLRGARADDVPMEEWDAIASVWTSTDGEIWAPTDFPDAGGEMCSVAARADGSFVAFGRIGESAAAWLSADGMQWTVASVEPTSEIRLPPDRLSLTCDIAQSDGVTLAALSDWDTPSSTTWTTLDGSTWDLGERLPLRVEGIAAIGDTVLAFGRDVNGLSALYRGTMSR